MNFNFLKQWIFDVFYKQDIVNKFDQLLKIQGTDGNWNYTEYHHGMYNGMVVMHYVISQDDEVEFKHSPEAYTKKLPDVSALCSSNM